MKRDIGQFNWDKLEVVNKDTLYDSGFKQNAMWMLPQILALINKIKLERVEDKISFLETWKTLTKTIDSGYFLFENGTPVSPLVIKSILGILTHTPRGDIMSESQNSGLGSRYSAAVPLFCSSFKEYRNIPYRDWDWDDEFAKYFVDKDIIEAIRIKVADYSLEELLFFREKALEIKTGKAAGTKRQAVSCTSAFGVTELRDVPRLTKLMLLQLWVYSPAIRHKLAILDPNNLDEMPEPLVSSDVMTKPRQEKASTNSVDEIPWLT